MKYLKAFENNDEIIHLTSHIRLRGSFNYNEDITKIKLIINNIKNLNVKDDKGEFPIITASKSKYIDVIRLLIDAGANVTVTDNNGNTPLMICVSSLSSLKILINAGANLNLKNNRGFTALILASYNHDYYSVKELVKVGANIHIKNINNNDFYDLADSEIKNWIEETLPEFVESKKYNL